MKLTDKAFYDKKAPKEVVAERLPTAEEVYDLIMKAAQQLTNNGGPVPPGQAPTEPPVQDKLQYYKEIGLNDQQVEQVMKVSSDEPAGSAAHPIDGQRDSLSKEEISGTGKLAQVDDEDIPETVLERDTKDPTSKFFNEQDFGRSNDIIEQEDAAENKLYKNLDPSSEAYKQWMDKRRRQQDQDEYADLAKLENSSDKNQKQKFDRAQKRHEEMLKADEGAKYFNELSNEISPETGTKIEDATAKLEEMKGKLHELETKDVSKMRNPTHLLMHKQKIQDYKNKVQTQERLVNQLERGEQIDEETTQRDQQSQEQSATERFKLMPLEQQKIEVGKVLEKIKALDAKGAEINKELAELDRNGATPLVNSVMTGADALRVRQEGIKPTDPEWPKYKTRFGEKPQRLFESLNDEEKEKYQQDLLRVAPSRGGNSTARNQLMRLKEYNAIDKERMGNVYNRLVKLMGGGGSKDDLASHFRNYKDTTEKEERFKNPQRSHDYEQDESGRYEKTTPESSDFPGVNVNKIPLRINPETKEPVLPKAKDPQKRDYPISVSRGLERMMPAELERHEQTHPVTKENSPEYESAVKKYMDEINAPEEDLEGERRVPPSFDEQMSKFITNANNVKSARDELEKIKKEHPEINLGAMKEKSGGQLTAPERELNSALLRYEKLSQALSPQEKFILDTGATNFDSMSELNNAMHKWEQSNKEEGTSRAVDLESAKNSDKINRSREEQSREQSHSERSREEDARRIELAKKNLARIEQMGELLGKDFDDGLITQEKYNKQYDLLQERYDRVKNELDTLEEMYEKSSPESLRENKALEEEDYMADQEQKKHDRKMREYQEGEKRPFSKKELEKNPTKTINKEDSSFSSRRRKSMVAQLAPTPPPSGSPMSPPVGKPMPGGKPGMPIGGPPGKPGIGKKPDERSLSEILDDTKENFEELTEKIEGGSTMDSDGSELVPVKTDTGSNPAPAPKISSDKLAVDQEAVGYWEDLYGIYGKQLAEDKVAEVVDIVDETAADFGIKLTASQVNKLIRLMTYATAQSASLFAPTVRAVTAHVISSGIINNDFTPSNGLYSALVELANASLNAEITEKIKLVAATEKMKTPRIKRKHDDAVKLDEMKDKADSDKYQLARPAHLKFTVDNQKMSGAYLELELSWDADAEAAKRTDAGIQQAIRSFVKGLESRKEFIDYGFMGKVVLREFDPEGGVATVAVRTNKPGEAPLAVETE